MGIESPLHLLFLGAVALIVLGPKRLPELARALGKGIREFRTAFDEGATPRTGGAPVLEREASEPLTVAPITAPVGSQLVGSEPVGSELAGSELTGSQLVGSEPVGSELVGSELAGSELAGSEPAGVERAGAEHPDLLERGRSETGPELLG
jgi:TatA/E family protein of Tat protein translocase